MSHTGNASGNFGQQGIIRTQQRLWTPDLVSPALWLDASDLSTITIDTGVSEWRDKSGNNRHLSQSQSARRPTFNPLGLNNLPTVSALSASQQWLSTNTNTSGFSGGSSLWAIIVCTMDSSTGSYGRLLSFGQVGLVDYTQVPLTPFLIRDAVTNTIISYRNGGVLSGVNVPTSTPMLVGSTFDGTQNILYLNGTAGTPVNSTGNFTSTPRLTLFWDQDPAFSSYWSGNCSELILGSTPLTTVNRQLIKGYLAWKWKLNANLPASHPFRTRPPLIGD